MSDYVAPTEWRITIFDFSIWFGLVGWLGFNNGTTAFIIGYVTIGIIVAWRR